MKTIMDIMGHQTIKVAMRYQHPSPDHKLDAVNRLGEIRKIFTPKVTPSEVGDVKGGMISTA